MKKRLLPFTFCFLLAFQMTLFSQVWIPKAENVLPPNYEISDISIVDSNIIWASAIDFNQAVSPVPATHVIKVMKTTNGGLTWQVFDVEEAMGRISWDIHGVDSLTAWITTQNLASPSGRGLFQTTDGGENWTSKLVGTAGGGWLHFYDSLSAACGVWNTIKTTDDGGTIWKPATNIPPLQTNEGAWHFTSASHLGLIGDTIWFGTSQGRVYRSADRGKSWVVYSSGQSGAIPSMAFVDSQVGILVHENGPDSFSLRKSIDGGKIWNPLNSNLENLLEIITIPGTTNLLGTSFKYGDLYQNLTAYSEDLGENWVVLDSTLSVAGPVFSSPDYGWVGKVGPTGTNPALYQWNSEVLVKASELFAGALQVKVFPNPFTNFVNIETSGIEVKSIRLLDGQGRIHADFPGQTAPVVTLELADISTGIYFLEIKTSGGFIVKKIVK